MKLKSFNYVSSENAVVLILGSMPGKESLLQQQYYAHPRNLFWDIMEQMLGINKSLPYQERLTKLKQNRIALWDVVSECRRKGSLDSNIDITSASANDFVSFFQHYNNIRNVFFNGKKAENLFKYFVLKKGLLEHVNLTYYYLPSTSPANASISREVKLEQWMKVKTQILSVSL
jgi:double-stranded uracil-DNA glycosylase